MYQFYDYKRKKEKNQNKIDTNGETNKPLNLKNVNRTAVYTLTLSLTPYLIKLNTIATIKEPETYLKKRKIKWRLLVKYIDVEKINKDEIDNKSNWTKPKRQ